MPREHAPQSLALAPLKKPGNIAAHVYATDLSGRLLVYIDRKRAAHGVAKGPSHTWSLRKLCAKTGIDWAFFHKLYSRKKIMSMVHMDLIMHALDISILDLLTQSEIAAALHHLDAPERHHTRALFAADISKRVAAALGSDVADSKPNISLDSGDKTA